MDLNSLARTLAERLMDQWKIKAGYSLAGNPMWERLHIEAEAVIREAIEKALDKAQRSMGYPGDVTAIKKIRQELRDGK